MLTKKSLIMLTVFMAATLLLTACGDKIEDSLNSTEKIVAKIEKIAEKKDFTQEDYKDYQNLMQELQAKSLKEADSLKGLEPSPKQQERSLDIMKRLTAAAMQCEMNNYGKN